MLFDQDKAQFRALVDEWAAKLEVEVVSISIREMRNKWASCSSSGRFVFNRELLALEKELQQYVVVHELAHVRVPNHGRLWKSLMRAYIGDYEDLEARLASAIRPRTTSEAVRGG
jgi:predicted metal-dependent hydrolase